MPTTRSTDHHGEAMTDERAAWRADASCRAGAGLELPWFGATVFVPFDDDWWFPERQGDPAFVAKRVCAACPVREECLADALERGEEFGIWGGAGEQTRRALRRLDGERQDAAVGRHFVRLDHLAAQGKAVRIADQTVDVAYGPNAQCGTASKYGRGCHCPRCTEAKRVDQRARRERKRTERRAS